MYSDFRIILNFPYKSTYNGIQSKLNQTDQDVEFEVYDGNIKLDKIKTLMRNRVQPGERVTLDIYQTYKIKDGRYNPYKIQSVKA